MKTFALTFTLLLLFSCGSSDKVKDEAFCACMETSEALNNESQRIMKGGDVLHEDGKKLKELRSKKNKACKAYATMSGDELQKRKEQCGSEKDQE